MHPKMFRTEFAESRTAVALLAFLTIFESAEGTTSYPFCGFKAIAIGNSDVVQRFGQFSVKQKTAQKTLPSQR
jgi:hypothetical protein